MMNEHADKLHAFRKGCIARLTELVKEKGLFYQNSGNYIASVFLPNCNVSVLMDNYKGYEKDSVLRVVYETTTTRLCVETNNSDLTHICNLTTDDIVKLCEFMEVLPDETAKEMQEYDHKHFLP